MSVDVGSAVGYLDIDITGFLSGLDTALKQTEASKNKIEALGGKISGVGDKLQSVGKSLTKNVTLPLVAVGTAGMKVATDFEKSMSEVSAITGEVAGQAGSKFDALRQQAIQLGASTAFSAGEVANAMTEMAKAGWTSQDILDGMSGVLDAAAASGEDLSSVATIMADALTGFGLEAGKATDVANLLTQAANSGTIGISDLGESFKYVAPVAGSMGVSIEDVTTALSAMSMAGIKGSQAGTSLRTILTSMTGPIEICGEKLGKVTIATTNADGTMRDLGSVLADCRVAFADLTEAEKAMAAEALVGKNSMSSLLALMNLSQDQYDAIAESMNNCTDVAKNTAEVMQDNLQSKLEQLGGSLESLAIVMADNVIPAFTNFIEWLTGMVEKFTELSPGAQKFILILAGIAAAVGPVLATIGNLTSGVGAIVTVIGKATGKASEFASAASTVAAPAEAAGKGVGSLAKSALNLLAAGAGIMMAAAGLALLAQSSIALAEAGWPAIGVMAGLVGTMALLAVGAAAIGPALTAGAVGLVAFGAAIALVGVGVLAASSGVALLATQLPTISEYGSQAASALLELGGGLLSFSGGALAAGIGLASLGSGLTVAAVGAVAAGVGIAALSVGVLALAAGTITLGAGLTLCGAGLTLMAASGETAATGMSSLAVAAAAAFLPISAGAVSCGVLDVALLSLLIPLAALTVELAASAVSCGLLSVAMEATASSVVTIEGSAASASAALKDMVTSVDTAKAGISSLGASVDSTMSAFVKTFSSAGKKASTEADNMSKQIETSISNGMKAAESSTKKSMNSMSSSVKSSLSDMNSSVNSGANKMENSMSSSMSSMNSAVKTGMSGILSSIKSGMESAVSYLKGLSGSAPSWGSDIIQGMANGIRSKLPALQSAVDAAAAIIYAKLHFSRPDEGPLRNYETWMPDFIKGLAKGIDSNSHLVETSVGHLADKMVVRPEYDADRAFSVESVDSLREYNITLVNTLGVYKQLVEQMKLCSMYSSLTMPHDNGLLDSNLSRHREVPKTQTHTVESEKPDNKPDQLVIPINIGEEQLETVVVDLLKREVRM